MSAAIPKGHTPYYFVPPPSAYPMLSAAALFFVVLGASQWVNGASWGGIVVGGGIVAWLAVLSRWFSTAIHESESGLYGEKIDASFRWSMAWFIFSEVMFFGAFFGALFWLRVMSVPELGNIENALLWPDFKALWPTVAAGITASPAGVVDHFQTMGPWPLPTINTALLLSSGVTLTIAHHALRDNKRGTTLTYMWLTIMLGAIFLCCQGFEYYEAYHHFNLKLSSGVYGSTFFMLTGFHGFHVFLGTLMLLFITLRIHKGHFTPERHFGFEGAAWYWHFVDVVWLGLYLIVYWT